MWHQSSTNTISVPSLTEYGWMIEDTKVCTVWDTLENILKIRKHVALLTRGCSCRSGCTTNRCSCVKMRDDHQCGPGCHCKNCENAAKYPLIDAHRPAPPNICIGNHMHSSAIWENCLLQVQLFPNRTRMHVLTC